MNQVQNELAHYGVLGMKWGKRKTSPNGQLSPHQQKRVSKQYKKLAVKVQENSDRTYMDRYVRAYNKTADEYNNGKIDEFNRTHSPKSKTYDQDYEEQFGRDLHKNFSKMLISDISKDANYQKAQALCEKYNMTSFDELAKTNARDLAEIKKSLG